MKKVNINTNCNTDLVSDLKNIPFLEKYPITINNASLFYNYYQDHLNCQKCACLDECINESNGYYTVVCLENGSYKAQMQMCKYKEERVRKNATSSLIETLYIPKSILNARLTDFDLSCQERKKLYNYAVNFVTNYQRDKFIKGLFIYGPYATGKTFLMAGIANELANRNIKSLLIYFPDMVREIKNSINTPRFDELINLLKGIDVLMIDDLGSEMMSSWLRDEVIGPIINYRVAEQLPIFISSNLSFIQLTEHFSKTKDGFNDDTKAARIIDRLKSLVVEASIGNQKYSR